MSRPPAYRPRRSSKRWLEGAPDYVLAVYDDPKFAERYTVLFGPPLWEPDWGRRVPLLGMSDCPTCPHGGVSMWGEMWSGDRACLGKKIRWLDLPEHIREHVRFRAEEQNE